MRSVMSVAIFGIILPLLVLKAPLQGSALPNVTLQAGKISIIVMGLGALLIGTSGSLPAVTTGSSNTVMPQDVVGSDNGP
jgi:hypothetical protein